MKNMTEIYNSLFIKRHETIGFFFYLTRLKIITSKKKRLDGLIISLI